MMKKFIIGSLATTLLISGAVGIHAYAQENDGKLVSKPLDDVTKTFISEKEAIAIAKKQVNGEVIKIELDSDDGRYEYDLDLRDDKGYYDITIDATTGKVLELDLDDDDDKDYVKATSTKSLITEKEAIAIAKKQVDGKVTEIELDEDDNRFEYEIEIRTNKGEADITIDATTGEVLELDIDND
ncbi:PepSY domain-containing protein [Psychrobacillus sp. NPDC096389]|uniref:PepSY domain-containing protein n=1 Tax=Psychrobacillus sp. NPDC096389 TaxID=3364490 RepID=UPI003808C9FE